MKVLGSTFNHSINAFKRVKKHFWLWIAILLPYVFIVYLISWHYSEIKKIPGSNILIINKSDYSLNVYSYKGELLEQFKIALGKNFGNKKVKGDLKTPEGIFQIVSIKDSKDWSYDFEDDGLPPIKGAFGPFFLRLEVPGFEGIGIHGTHDNKSLGTRASHGCIRMNNKDLKKLKNEVTIGTVVVIVPSVNDLLVK